MVVLVVHPPYFMLPRPAPLLSLTLKSKDSPPHTLSLWQLVKMIYIELFVHLGFVVRVWIHIQCDKNMCYSLGNIIVFWSEFSRLLRYITTFFKAVCDPGNIKGVFLFTFVFTGWWKYIALTKIFYYMCLESAKGKLSSPTSKNKFYSIFYSSYFFIN